MSGPVHDLELVDITKRYGTTIAVNEVSHQFKPQSYTCQLGLSRCGKSLTLRMIAGHDTVSDGAVLRTGRDISQLPPAKRGTATMFQNYALFPHRSVFDNVAFCLKMKGVDLADRHAKAGEMQELVDLVKLADRLPAQLWGGHQQRVSLTGWMTLIPTIYNANAATLGIRPDLIKRPIESWAELLPLNSRAKPRSSTFLRSASWTSRWFAKRWVRSNMPTKAT